MEDLLNFNGIDAISGNYLMPPIEPGLFAKAVEGSNLDPKEIEELKNWYFAKTQPNMGLKEGDPRFLDQAGWGVIFPSNGDPAVRQALSELLAWRQEQASRLHANYYHEFSGEDGYKPGESKLGWLARHNMGPGPAEPERVPYYLLLVGDPQAIPYRFQTQLDIQYASGRLYFETLEEYAQYAHSVVEAEQRQLARPRKITFFGVSSPDDPATNLSSAELVRPLAEDTSRDYSDWLVQAVPPEQANKQRLAELFGGSETPALLFTASHGMGFPNGHPLQYSRQGALLTGDWPGPKQHSGPIPEDYYFAARDVSDDARVFGMLAFLFACYGAGTPQLDEFAQSAFKDSRAEIAPKPFLAALPQRLLSHPRGSALAVVGHIDRAWGYSFYWGSAKRQLAVFEKTLNLLLNGYPVGAALDPFYIRYAELSANLNDLLEDISFGKKYEPRELAGLWTANNDARNYAVIGDPAVRLMAAAPGAPGVIQPEIELRAQSGAAQPGAAQAPAAAQDDLGKTVLIRIGETASLRRSLGRLYSVAKDSSYPLPELKTILIGRRDPASGIYPDIDLSSQGETSATVSRRHARLTIQDQQVFIEDLNSRNLTQLNGKQLAPGQRSPLKNGDELKIGAVLLVYLAY